MVPILYLKEKLNFARKIIGVLLTLKVTEMLQETEIDLLRDKLNVGFFDSLIDKLNTNPGENLSACSLNHWQWDEKELEKIFSETAKQRIATAKSKRTLLQAIQVIGLFPSSTEGKFWNAEQAKSSVKKYLSEQGTDLVAITSSDGLRERTYFIKEKRKKQENELERVGAYKRSYCSLSST